MREKSGRKIQWGSTGGRYIYMKWSVSLSALTEKSEYFNEKTPFFFGQCEHGQWVFRKKKFWDYFIKRCPQNMKLYQDQLPFESVIRNWHTCFGMTNSSLACTSINACPGARVSLRERKGFHAFYVYVTTCNRCRVSMLLTQIEGQQFRFSPFFSFFFKFCSFLTMENGITDTNMRVKVQAREEEHLDMSHVCVCALGDVLDRQTNRQTEKKKYRKKDRQKDSQKCRDRQIQTDLVVVSSCRQ